MNSSSNNHATFARRSSRRPGFTFTEVLFAVMIMGIGFIMIAAMFPATIRQTATTIEETNGAMIARAAAQYLQSIASDQTMPPTATAPNVPGIVKAISPVNNEATVAFDRCQGNFIMSQNRRYGWVACYRRDVTDQGPADYAQVFVIAAECRNRSEYLVPGNAVAAWDDLQMFGSNPPTLAPRKVRVNVAWDGGRQQGVVTFTGSPGGGGAVDGSWIASPGAYLIIARDPTTGTTPGRLTGRIYQLGNPLGSNNVWGLAPGGDMQVFGTAYDDYGLSGVEAYMLGSGYADPSTNSFGYAGAAQDISIYTTFVRIAK